MKCGVFFARHSRESGNPVSFVVEARSLASRFCGDAGWRDTLIGRRSR